MNDRGAHYARTARLDRVARVYFGDELLLQCDAAVRLTEYCGGKAMDPVIYFPESVVAALDVTPSARVTHCPIKGDASYLDFRTAPASIWSYRDPLPGVDAIRNHVAFDLGRGFRVEVE